MRSKFSSSVLANAPGSTTSLPESRLPKTEAYPSKIPCSSSSTSALKRICLYSKVLTSLQSIKKAGSPLHPLLKITRDHPAAAVNDLFRLVDIWVAREHQAIGK